MDTMRVSMMDTSIILRIFIARSISIILKMFGCETDE